MSYFGKTESGRALHVHVSFPPKVVVVTLYEHMNLIRKNGSSAELAGDSNELHFCGGKVELQKVTFVYDHDKDYFLIENVPAEVCMQCGEKTYTPKVTDDLTRLAKGRLKPSRTVRVPVYDYPSQAIVK